MTSEKRILVSPKDILGIGFECSHCGATFFVPLDNLDRPLLRHCPNCQDSLATDASVSGNDHSDARVLSFFIDFLQQLRARSFGMNIRFEISEDVATPSNAQKSGQAQ
jgi:hypothetical protein